MRVVATRRVCARLISVAGGGSLLASGLYFTLQTTRRRREAASFTCPLTVGKGLSPNQDVYVYTASLRLPSLCLVGKEEGDRDPSWLTLSVEIEAP